MKQVPIEPQPNFEKAWQNAFQNAELMPPDSEQIWRAVAYTLPKPTPIHRQLWFRVAGVAASVAVFVGVSLYIGTPPATHTQKVTETPQAQVLVRTSPNSEESLTTQKYTKPLNATPKANPTAQSKHPDNAYQNKNEMMNLTAKPTAPKQNPKAENAKASPVTEGSGTNTESNTTATNEQKLLLLPILWAEQTAQPQLVAGKMVLPMVVVVNQETKQTNAPKDSPKLAWWGGIQAYYTLSNLNFRLEDVNQQNSYPLVKQNNPNLNFVVLDSSKLAENLQNKHWTSSASINVEFGRNIGKHFSVASGFFYSQVAHSVENYIGISTNIGALGGAITYNAVQTHLSEQRLSVPLRLVYESGGKFGYQASVGLTADFALNRQLRHNSNSFSDPTLYVTYNLGEPQSIGASALAGIGFYYALTEHLQFNTEFNARQSLNSSTNSAHLKTFPTLLGVGLGVRYKF